MNAEINWKTRSLRELEHALHARSLGNEGMARVCARRAAGLVIREFLRRTEGEVERASAYETLRRLLARTDLSQEIRALVLPFTQAITFDHELPVETDLIADVSRLAELLLGERLGQGPPN